MKRNVSVVRLTVATRSSNILIGGKIIKEIPGSVASGTHCITEDLYLTDIDYFSHHEISSKKKIYWLYHYFFSLGDFQQIEGKFYTHVKVLRLNTVELVDVDYKSEQIYEFGYELQNSLTFTHTVYISKAEN